MHNALLRICLYCGFLYISPYIKAQTDYFFIYIQTIYIGQGEGNKTFFSFSVRSAFSRHDNVRANSTLFIWINENILFVLLEKCVFSP